MQQQIAEAQTGGQRNPADEIAAKIRVVRDELKQFFGTEVPSAAVALAANASQPLGKVREDVEKLALEWIKLDNEAAKASAKNGEEVEKNMAKEAERFGAREQALKVGADENAILAAQIAGNDLLVKQLKDQLALDRDIAALEKLGFTPEEATALATKTQALRDQLALKQAAEKSAKEEAKAAEEEAKAAAKIAAEKEKAAYDHAKGAVDERAKRHGRTLTQDQEERAIGHEIDNQARREAESAKTSKRNDTTKGNFDDIFHKDDPNSPNNRALDQIETDAGNNSGEGLGAAAEKHKETAGKLSGVAEKLNTSAESYDEATTALNEYATTSQSALSEFVSTLQQMQTDLQNIQSQVNNLRTA